MDREKEYHGPSVVCVSYSGEENEQMDGEEEK